MGVSAAKALALVADVPYVGVNHLEAHLYAAWLEDPDLAPPLAVLIASGGHTLVVIVEDHGRYRVVGQTVDDAAGEAFDKVARFLGLGYPGGPAIDRLSGDGDPEAIAFPRAMPGEADFSFSGLKTAVVNHVRRSPDAAVADVAASFQAAVVDQLADKLVAAADAAGASALVLGGGVAANSALRARVEELAAASGRKAFLPPLALCTDNAAMIAAAAWWRLRADGPTPLDAGVDPGLPPHLTPACRARRWRVSWPLALASIECQRPIHPRSAAGGTPDEAEPLEDRIVVRSNEPEETTVSGLVIPDTAKEKPQQGEVLAVGPGRRSEQTGEIIPVDVSVGDTVVYSKYGGTEITVDGEDLLILTSRDVLAKVGK